MSRSPGPAMFTKSQTAKLRKHWNGKRFVFPRRGGVLKRIVRKAKRRQFKRSAFKLNKRIQYNIGFTNLRVYQDATVVAPPGTPGAVFNIIFSFSANDIATNTPNQLLGQYLNMYSWYRCRKCVVTIVPLFTQINITDGGQQPSYIVKSVWNFQGDAFTAGSDNGWSCIAGYRETWNNKWHTRVYRPNVQTIVSENQAGGGTADAMFRRGGCPWLNTRDTGIQMYGVNFAFRNVGSPESPTSYRYQLRVRTYWVFKQIKIPVNDVPSIASVKTEEKTEEKTEN